MKAFRAMLTASVLMLARNRLLIITSLGLALISILVFGSLFGSNGTARPALGVVNEDDSPLAAQVVTQLRRRPSLVVSSGAARAAVQSLRDGHRHDVLLMPAGSG